VSDPVFTLFSSGLLSKWGFNDGDAPGDVLDWFETQGLGWRIEWHPVLRVLVDRYLLPVLDQAVTVVHSETSHNPVRAETVDGADVTCWWYEHDGAPELTPEYVEIPLAEVARIAADLEGTADGRA
jgi:hypothetical protein